MYNTEKQMQEIMEAPQLSSWEKSKFCSDYLNRLLMFKNRISQKSMETLVQRAPSMLSNVSEPPSFVSPEAAEINARLVPVTPKPHFLTSSAKYERFLLRDRPKYIPMKPEQIAKLPPEERRKYENSLKITKTPKRYALRSRPY